MDAVDFTISVSTATSVQQVSAQLADFGAQFGFPVHVISPVPKDGAVMDDPGFLVQNWPDGWHEAYMARGFYEFDPIPRAATLVSRPMTIAAIQNGAAGFTPDPRSRALFEKARAFGQACGLLVPIFGPNGYRGIVCYAGAGPDPDAQGQARLHLAAIYAHDRARTLSFARHGSDLTLSARELDVLRLIGSGLGDEDVAMSLGITVRTVRFHASNARTKLAAANRIEAVATAKNMGLI